MVLWVDPALESMRERIAQLGLSRCLVCGSESLQVLRLPILAHMGGHLERHEEERDPTINVLCHVAVVCDLCGHTLF